MNEERKATLTKSQKQQLPRIHARSQTPTCLLVLPINSSHPRTKNKNIKNTTFIYLFLNSSSICQRSQHRGKKFEHLISPKRGKRKTTKLIVLKLNFLFEWPALNNVRAATTKGLCLLFSSKFQLLLFYCDWAESQDHRILTPSVSMCLVLRVGGSF